MNGNPGVDLGAIYQVLSFSFWNNPVTKNLLTILHDLCAKLKEHDRTFTTASFSFIYLKLRSREIKWLAQFIPYLSRDSI